MMAAMALSAAGHAGVIAASVHADGNGHRECGIAGSEPGQMPDVLAARQRWVCVCCDDRARRQARSVQVLLGEGPRCPKRRSPGRALARTGLAAHHHGFNLWRRLHGTNWPLSQRSFRVMGSTGLLVPSGASCAENRAHPAAAERRGPVLTFPGMWGASTANAKRQLKPSWRSCGVVTEMSQMGLSPAPAALHSKRHRRGGRMAGVGQLRRQWKRTRRGA